MLAAKWKAAYAPYRQRRRRCESCRPGAKRRPVMRFAGCGSAAGNPDANTHWRGAIAQLGERLLCKQEVVGSIPSGSTRRRRHLMLCFCFRSREHKFARLGFRLARVMSDIVKRRSIRAPRAAFVWPWSGALSPCISCDRVLSPAKVVRGYLRQRCNTSAKLDRNAVGSIL